MGLIQGQVTEEQKLIKTRADLDGLLLGGARSLYTFSQQVWALFWSNPDGLACQQVFDSFGTDALTMAQMLMSAKALIDKVDPTIWKLERPGTVAPVLGDDGKPTGRVTVTLTPP